MSDAPSSAPKLNANQRRSVEAMLESLEGALLQVERLLPDSRGVDQDSGVTVVQNDLPLEFTANAGLRIADLRMRILALARKMDVASRRVSKRRTVRGLLSAQLVRVEDITPSRLRSYGELHPSFNEQISPSLKDIQGSLKELLELIKE
jgi:hypothetical protein